MSIGTILVLLGLVDQIANLGSSDSRSETLGGGLSPYLTTPADYSSGGSNPALPSEAGGCYLPTS